MESHIADGTQRHISRVTGVLAAGHFSGSVPFSSFRRTAFSRYRRRLGPRRTREFLCVCACVAMDLHFLALRLASVFALGVSAPGHGRAHPGVSGSYWLE